MFAYVLNYNEENKMLCAMEMRRLFQKEMREIIYSNKDYRAGRSIFFKAKIEIVACEENKERFLDVLSTVYVEKFKVCYVKTKNDSLSYETRMDLVKACATKINGKGCLDESATLMGVFYDEGRYYFGYLSSDHQTWQKHQNKPQSYSQSLSVKDARSIVNIATAGLDKTLVDVCCGVGTVLLEAMEMGHRIVGYELNKGVAWKANRNLEYFHYPKIVQNKDMHTISDRYDVAILDIPYNLYSTITKYQQEALIKKCHDIANELVLISHEDFSEVLVSNGFTIVDVCEVKKIKMIRYIYHCISLDVSFIEL